MRLEQKKVSKPSIFGFFLEKEMSFFKKNLIFLEIEKGGKFTVECVSNGTIPQKYIFCTNFFWKLEKLENMLKKEFFFEKKSVLKPCLEKWEGTKNAGCSRPSCSFVIKSFHTSVVFVVWYYSYE